MDTQKCWYCSKEVDQEDAVFINIDGAEETVHKACSESIAESVG